MTDADGADLFAYLRAQPPVRQENRRHALDFPYNLRFALDLWQALFFAPATFAPESGRDAVWNRGAYLVRHVAHCGERSEGHTSELQSLMRISYAVFCLKKKITRHNENSYQHR